MVMVLLATEAPWRARPATSWIHPAGAIPLAEAGLAPYWVVEVDDPELDDPELELPELAVVVVVEVAVVVPAAAGEVVVVVPAAAGVFVVAAAVVAVVAVVVAAVLAAGLAVPVNKVIALGPPQISFAFPEHAMTHCPETNEREAPFARLFPQ